MINILFHAYFLYFSFFSVLALIALIFGIFWIYKIEKKYFAKKSVNNLMPDMQAIAGDDIFATQLDLAAAYIQTGNFPDARNMLAHVAATGSKTQQKEARALLLDIEALVTS